MGKTVGELVVGRRYVDKAREERIMNLVSQGVYSMTNKVGIWEARDERRLKSVR